MPDSTVDAVAEAIWRETLGVGELGWRFSDNTDDVNEHFRRTARAAIDVYVASVRPVVSTVEQLDALPVRTLVVSEDGQAFRRMWDIPKVAAGFCWRALPGNDYRATDLPLPLTIAWQPGRDGH